MGFFKEFKDFAMKGNVIDLATAVIIGGAFGKIISSMVSDVLMPPIGLLVGKVDFKDLKLVIRAAEGANPAVTMNYGMFIQNVIDFLIVAFCIFIVVKAYQRATRRKQEAPAAPAEPSNQEKLLTEIRDLLKEQSKS
jgi:large conductance mechanosensitive channel